MWTLIRVGLDEPRRDRVVQALTFLLPIVFFSIFATVFGGRQSGTPRIDVAVVDEDHSDFSQRLAAGLAKESGSASAGHGGRERAAPALTRAAAEELVQGGDRARGGRDPGRPRRSHSRAAASRAVGRPFSCWRTYRIQLPRRWSTDFCRR